MRRMSLVVAAALCIIMQGPAHAQSQLKCLTEAILAESTLSNESLEADKLVGYNIANRVADGRWGKTYCETIYMKYAKVTVQVVKKKVGGKVRLIKKAVKTYTCDYSYHCIARYAGILRKASKEKVAQAEEAARAVLSGTYEPKPELKATLYYMYRKYSGKRSIKWFDCVTHELGKADLNSVHVHSRDQTDEELAVTLKDHPECAEDIRKFQLERDTQNNKKVYAHTW